MSKRLVGGAAVLMRRLLTVLPLPCFCRHFPSIRWGYHWYLRAWRAKGGRPTPPTVTPLRSAGESCALPSTHPLELARIHAAPPLLSALWPSSRGSASRLRTRSIARSLARTIATCPKSAPPCALAPQLVGAEVAHVRARLCRRGVVATSSSPTQTPTAEALENQGGPADYGSQGRAPPALHLSSAYSR